MAAGSDAGGADKPQKAPSALRTIGELSDETGIAQHILRFWETRFPQLKPLQRAGKRRYYRPEDVALVKRIDQLLNQDGYTVKGVQGLLRKGDAGASEASATAPVRTDPPAPTPAPPQPAPAPRVSPANRIAIDGLGPIRALLVRALAEDA